MYFDLKLTNFDKYKIEKSFGGWQIVIYNKGNDTIYIIVEHRRENNYFKAFDFHFEIVFRKNKSCYINTQPDLQHKRNKMHDGGRNGLN